MRNESEHQKKAYFQNDREIPEPWRMPYRWLMLALLWLLYFSFGVISRSSAPLVTPMLRDLHMSYGQMGLVLGSWQLTYIIVAVIAGVFIDKWGIRISLFIGVIVISLSAALRFFSSGFVTLLVYVALFGLGGPMISIGAPKTITMWFKGKDRGTAVGIYSTGPRIGGIIALAATNAVVMPLTGYSWRLTFVFYGVLTFCVGLLWLIFAKEAETARESERLNINKVFFSLIQQPNVRIILLSGLLSFAMMHGFTTWLPKILETVGMSPATAGISASIPLLASLPAVLIIPRTVPLRLRAQAISLLALFASAGLLLVAVAEIIPIIGLLMYGVTGPIIFPLLMLSLMEMPEVGSKYMGSAAGIFFCVAEIGGVLGPFVMGFLVDLTGTFFAGASFLASLGFIIFALMFLIRTRPAAH